MDGVWRWCGVEDKEGKAFFFGKKNQKTFALSHLGRSVLLQSNASVHPL